MYQHYVLLGIGIVSAIAFVVFLFSSGTLRVDITIIEKIVKPEEEAQADAKDESQSEKPGENQPDKT